MTLTRRLLLTWPLAAALPSRAQAGGRVLLLRHAQTVPGIGDPPQFRLGDCATQRNLSDEGRAQARRLGPLLAARGLTPQQVRSSQWCRCTDTAQLAFGRAEPWPALNSFFQGQGDRDRQTAALRAALAAVPPGRIEAWVTHMVNITALTGEGVAMGEVLVLDAATGRIVERIQP